MVIFHSYVSLPEGKGCVSPETIVLSANTGAPVDFPFRQASNRPKTSKLGHHEIETILP